jgi:hypothetical protein
VVGVAALDGLPHVRALNVLVTGDDVVILFGDGATVRMSADAAEMSARRLLDAAEVARGRVPHGPR